VPLPDGATMVTFIDVTDSVNVEHALRDKNEALIEADKIKTDFVGLVSYELRSPLNVISGFAHLLADPKIGTLNDKQLEYADHIQSSSESLRTLIDDILEIAGIDAGIIKIEPEPVDTQSLVSSVLEALKDRVAEAGLLVNVRIAPLAATITADPNRLRQILYNLVSNAIRFSHPRGRLEIELSAEANEHVLTVRDTGSGIPADQIAFVFDRFYTRRQGQRRGGAGLGLALVKSFVELHGGSVGIESKEGQGTEVTCRFPRSPAVELTTTAA
jgi:signal transduction histidine kinase